MTIFLHKTAIVNFSMATTVDICNKKLFILKKKIIHSQKTLGVLSSVEKVLISQSIRLLNVLMNFGNLVLNSKFYNTEQPLKQPCLSLYCNLQNIFRNDDGDGA